MALTTTRKRKADEGDSETAPVLVKHLKTSCNEQTLTFMSSDPTPGGDIGKLPAELRNYIYELVLAPDPTDIRTNIYSRHNRRQGDGAAAWHEPGLLHTCKSTRKDAFAYYFQDRSFVLFAADYEFQKIYSWLKAISDRCESGKMPKFQLQVTHCNMGNVLSLVALAKIVHQFGAIQSARSNSFRADTVSFRRYLTSSERKVEREDRSWDFLASMVIGRSHSAKVVGVTWERFKVRVVSLLAKSVEASSDRETKANKDAILQSLKRELECA